MSASAGLDFSAAVRAGPHHGLGLCLGDLARFHRGGEPALDRTEVLGVGDAEGEEGRAKGEAAETTQRGSRGKRQSFIMVSWFSSPPPVDVWEATRGAEAIGGEGLGEADQVPS